MSIKYSIRMESAESVHNCKFWFLFLIFVCSFAFNFCFMMNKSAIIDQMKEEIRILKQQLKSIGFKNEQLHKQLLIINFDSLNTRSNNTSNIGVIQQLKDKIVSVKQRASLEINKFAEQYKLQEKKQVIKDALDSLGRTGMYAKQRAIEGGMYVKEKGKQYFDKLVEEYSLNEKKEEIQAQLGEHLDDLQKKAVEGGMFVKQKAMQSKQYLETKYSEGAEKLKQYWNQLF